MDNSKGGGMWDEFLLEENMVGVADRMKKEQIFLNKYLERCFMVYCFPPNYMATTMIEKDEVCPECGSEL